MPRPHLLPALALAALCAPASSLVAQVRTIEIETIPVAGGVHMLKGRGGNIGLCVGKDGPFLVDDQFANLTGKITAAVKELSEEPIRFVVNTHWHGDHTGGNENLGGAGAIIVAHENVRKRLSTDQFIEAFGRTVEALEESGRPVITFTEDITFHWNDEEVHVFHVKHAHTDGDAFIHFRRANVLHLGDVYFNHMYPFIDVSTGGTLPGVIRAVDRALALADENTKIIPGHGELSGVAELREYRAMLVTVRDRVQKLIDEGRSREEVIAARPTSEFDAEWASGFLDAERWTGIVFDAMQPRRE